MVFSYERRIRAGSLNALWLQCNRIARFEQILGCWICANYYFEFELFVSVIGFNKRFLAIMILIGSVGYSISLFIKPDEGLFGRGIVRGRPGCLFALPS